MSNQQQKPERQCLGCGTSLEGTHWSRTWCRSDECEQLRRRLRERKKQRRRRETNPEKIRRYEREKTRRWRAAHPHRVREQQRLRYVANPRAFLDKNRERYLKRGGNGHRSNATIAACIDRDGLICAWCGSFLDDPYDGSRTHVDHIVPPEHGGSSGLDNLQLLHASCNESKQDQPMTHAPSQRCCTSRETCATVGA